ncbi:MAG: glycosyl hydrolase [Eubacteriaceae bacterium]|nr:glycosyl hydrolase [Eubacteriaceae bacterium]
MTLQEKASLCSGEDFWHLKGIARLGIPSIMVTDGPHGVRKQTCKTAANKLEENIPVGSNESIPATCFPTAVTLGSSWDRKLMKEIGIALGEECLQEEVSVILGPGLNIKRAPQCGRNFEYISEDPYVTGEMGAALIQGVQSKGVGTSVKHFAVNNQEKYRMVIDSVVDERALREIYLAGFETAVREASPWTVMSAYNKVNGTYCSENKKLLKEILRDDWGFEGLVISDWGATDDRVQGLKAGLDLEMPASQGINDKKIVEAVENNQLEEAVLDRTVERILKLILQGDSNKKAGFTYDVDAHHALAGKASSASMVLLKNNENILPLNSRMKIAVIGEFARRPRYQGAGSSLINPTRLDNIFDELTSRKIDFSYARGYDVNVDRPNQRLIEEACKASEGADVVLVFAGLTERYESEGYDRMHMAMPEAHNRLIKVLGEINRNLVVVLSGGSPVEMPWINDVKGLLNTYLGGQAGAAAVIDILFGIVNPSGKLAETYPLKLEDSPAYRYFAKGKVTAEYRESIYVGYRFYEKANREVLFPFGYGLSYTAFEYSDLKLSKAMMKDTEVLKVCVRIKNIGEMAGAEIAQLYVRDLESTIFRPVKELKGFQKVFLEPGEEKNLEFLLDGRSFAYYNVNINGWHVEEGEFLVMMGASSRDIRLEAKIFVRSSQPSVDVPNYKETAPSYYHLTSGVFSIDDHEFEAVYGRGLPPSKQSPTENFTMNSLVEDMGSKFIGRLFLKIAKGRIKKLSAARDDNDPAFRFLWSTVMESPLRTVVVVSDGTISLPMTDAILKLINGKYLRGGYALARAIAFTKCFK